jgi:hypothetical protein
MGLETPLALLGLAAALLPWLAHRIHRRDLPPVLLPTVALLRKAEANKRRSRGLTDLLLLALRVALVIAAALGVAAPYATARLSFGDGSIASAAIVIDDSLSMMRREGSETLLQTAVNRARRALASLPQGSEVTLIAAGQHARVLVRHTTDLGLARLELDRLAQSSMRGTDLSSALSLATEQLKTARHPTRRVLLLSDFASHSGLTPEAVRIEGVQVVLERVGSVPAPANLYFSSVRALPDPSAHNQTSLAIEIAAYGEAPERVPVSVRSGGREIASASLKLVAGRARDVIQVPTPAPDADPTALLHIDASDVLEADNSAGVLLRPSDAVQVMLVNGDPHPASSRDELYYALRALRLSSGVEGGMGVRVVDANALAKYDLAQVDGVVLANADAPDGATAARLLRFVRQGGGLIVAAGDRVQARAYDAALSELLPCRIRARSDGPEIGIAQPSATSRLGLSAASGLGQTRAHKRLMLDCDSEVHLRFSDGAPALAETSVGRGRSALLAVSLDADWSDLPLRPGYLPLLARLIREVAGAGLAINGPVAAGSPVRIAVPPEAARMEVVGPDGLRTRFDDVKGKPSVELAATDSAGPYRVLAAGERGTLADVPRGAFVVESPHAESELGALADVQSWGPRAARGSSGTYVKQTLAPYVLLVFAMLALLEGLLRLRAR